MFCVSKNDLDFQSFGKLWLRQAWTWTALDATFRLTSCLLESFVEHSLHIGDRCLLMHVLYSSTFVTSDVFSKSKYLPTQCLDWNASSIEFYERAGAVDNDDYCRKDEHWTFLRYIHIRYMNQTHAVNLLLYNYNIDQARWTWAKPKAGSLSGWTGKLWRLFWRSNLGWEVVYFHTFLPLKTMHLWSGKEKNVN